jgi:hypothetical protein
MITSCKSSGNTHPIDSFDAHEIVTTFTQGQIIFNWNIILLLCQGVSWCDNKCAFVA